MSDTDPRNCGTGACLIDPDGHCWCGQQWDGDRMVPPTPPGGLSDAEQARRAQDQADRDTAV
ncbi:hypothetical protein [Ideonella margarita]|uniref:Uncharacterized protein n=1 Tax=Ideonella margarita TaxID=2984191 RepID=A0ABU9BYZ9_9BURK